MMGRYVLTPTSPDFIRTHSHTDKRALGHASEDSRADHSLGMRKVLIIRLPFARYMSTNG